MRKIYCALCTWIFIAFAAQVCYAQSQPDLRTSSYYTFIYKLTNAQAGVLYENIQAFDSTFITRLYDIYPTDSAYKKVLPVGHYLYVKASELNVITELRSVDNVNIRILNNHRDLLLVVHDSLSLECKDADVRLSGKRLPFDQSTQTYRLKKSNRKGLLTVSHRGHVSHFEIDRQYNNGWVVRSGRKIIQFAPVRIILSPFRYIVGNVQDIVKGYGPRWPYVVYRLKNRGTSSSTAGYMAFNKPIYKPGDTVKLKAFLTSRKGRELSKPLEVYVTNNYPYVKKKLGVIKPVRKGSYPFEFMLHDSLNLPLDEDYLITLKRNGKQVFSGRFKYEEYELRQNKYTAEHKVDPATGKPVLFLKGTDSNEMPVYDVQAEVLVKPVKALRFYEASVFVPDTLWFHKTRLEPMGETKVLLPDSIFPAADISYGVEVSFFNSAQERLTKTISLEYVKDKLPVSISLENDSLVIRAFSGFVPGEALKLEAWPYSGKPAVKSIVLPYRELVKPTTERYRVTYKSLESVYLLERQPDNLFVMSNRTADSLFVSTQNARQIRFNYFLFRNQQLIESGQTQALDIRRQAKIHDVYHLSIQYLWAGESRNQEFTIPFDQSVLKVDLQHPAKIYPGQKVDFTIQVTDARGKAVRDADLTASAVSKKFQSRPVVNVPDLSKPVKNRKIINTFKLAEQTRYTRFLENSYWKNTLGLDSLTFYNLAEPDSGYFETRFSAATAQLAPFVAGTTFEKAYIVYVDNVPVYYQGVTTVQPYSIAVRPGKHTVTLRVSDALITVSDVMIYENQKLIFSVDKRKLPWRAQKVEMPYSLTPDEIKLLSRHFTMIRIPDSRTPGYIKQDDRFFMAKPNEYYYNNTVIAGPFFPGQMTFVTEDHPPVDVDYEPLYKYEFQKNVIKLREYDASAIFRSRFLWGDNSIPLEDHVLTADSIHAYWKAIREARFFKFRTLPDSPSPINSKLTLEVSNLSNQRVLATFLVNLDNPDQYYLFPGLITNQPVSPGHYEAAVLLRDTRYKKMDSIFIKTNGLNYYYDGTNDFRDADSLGVKIIGLLWDLAASNSYVEGYRAYEMQQIRNQYYRQASNNVNYGNFITGQLTSAEDGNPLPGVSVMAKRTAIGTQTDVNGYYTLNCPPGSVLVFSFIGLKTQEISTAGQSMLDVMMEADATMLNEVVVVAGGLTVQRRELGSSVTTVRRGLEVSAMTALEGKAPGLMVSRIGSGLNPDYRVVLRGQRSLVDDSRALVIIDGRIASAEEINEASITAIEILSEDSASARYGSIGVNGVLIISTKSGATLESLREMASEVFKSALPEEAPGNSLRRNFRDYAFWKPNLRTDERGIASFEATFADDVTGWDVSVLAMASKRRTGQTSGVIRSFKPMTAQIGHPQFLIEGDHSKAIGKVTAYNAGKVTATRIALINNEQVLQHTIAFENSITDSIPLMASEQDTISVEYTISVDRYQDGELRKIPVLKRGALEAVGSFIAINNDTTFTVPAAEGELIIHGEVDLTDVLLDEINYLRQYRYECNEQMASRLFALLSAKQIMKLRGEPFRYEREIQKVAGKLSANQNHDGGWAWWNSGGESDPWVTLHVAKSLILTKELGYVTSFDRHGVFYYLENSLATLPKHNYLSTAKFLLEHKRLVEVKVMANGLRNAPTASVYEKLLAERLLQLSGEKTDWNRVKALRSETLKGNYRWGEERTSLYDNQVLNTLLAYEIGIAAGANPTDLTKIKNFFLEVRERTWRNTYESACVIHALTSGVDGHTPDLKPTITVSGGMNISKQRFPIDVKGKTSAPVTVSVYTHGSPVYFTAYREIWNSSPAKNDKKFRVETSFRDGQNLLAGKPVTLDVTVEVKSDAEYIMIEIPIPAGCSYQSKKGSASNGEVHREHYVNKTNIYCRSIKKGTYTYSIFLLPRFSGRYTVNPAVAQSMYFPVLHGNNEIKAVTIE